MMMKWMPLGVPMRLVSFELLGSVPENYMFDVHTGRKQITY